MTSALAGPLDGQQLPRAWSAPEYKSSAGEEAVELAAMTGLILDPWQQFVLQSALGEDENGKWSAFEVGLVVSRQNGKGAILEARELAGLFLLGERLIIHSAHQFDTSLEAFRRLLALVEDTPDLSSRVRRVSRAHGEEGIELKTGQRIRFRTRTKAGGRGFTGDCLILDEAMELAEAAHGALLPTLSARPNPQVWYTGSAVDQMVHEHGVVLARIRERGLIGDEALAYFEWSTDASLEDALADDTVSLSEQAWAEANPGLGIRISAEHIGREQRSMDARTFLTERLGVGDWPATDASDRRPIPPELWLSLEDPGSQVQEPVCLSFDVKPDRSYGSVCLAGSREDSLGHVEVVRHERGTSWIAKALRDLSETWGVDTVICDASGPAGSLVPALEDMGLRVHTVTAREHTQACGLFYDAAVDEMMRHTGQSELRTAVLGACTRPLGDAWAWSRKSSTVDISPLVACTLAFWGSSTMATTDDFVFEVMG